MTVLVWLMTGKNGEVIDELNEHLEGLRVQKELFFDLEVKIMQKSLDMTDIKSLEFVDGDTSQEIRKTIANGSEGDKLTSVPIDESEDISINGVVDLSQFDESSSKTSKKIGEGG